MSSWLQPEDWKRGIALVILWAYAYQLVAWPLLFWGTTLLTAFSGAQWPAPPIVPWEQLLAGTTTLAAVGGIQTWREMGAPPGQFMQTTTTQLTQPLEHGALAKDAP